MGGNKLRKLGIIAAPGWFDPTMGEFMQRHPDELKVTQTIMPPPGFDYSFGQIASSEPALEASARLLAEAGSQVVAQVGPAFAYLIGKSPAGARALGQRLSDACGVPVMLNGVAVLDAMDEIGCRRVAVACPYYSPEWKQTLLQFLIEANLSVESFQTFVEQGIFPSQDEVSARRYDFTDAEVIESVRRTRASGPYAEAVLIGGSGVRTLSWIEDLQSELGLPLISADHSLYQSVLKIIGLKPNARAE